ncbi:YciI family protein [Parasphingorhabdus sp.]|uniref:YciI family protein n=1 Tax=Parasphingorhabdus sp. TaxID=2709688 RepID=UPI003A93B388|tara:strand:+ start:15843 stop:16145 length:303 start_codon:yes stop_codon:yes gene_type:complete
MKTYAIYCTDRPETAQARLDARNAHFTHIEKVLDDILIAGPLVGPGGITVGSMLVVKAKDEKSARILLERDPYFQADIWTDIRITEFIPAAGEWIGGKIW